MLPGFLILQMQAPAEPAYFTVLNALAGSPALALFCATVAITSAFLAVIWLRLQPQPFFLHVIIFNTVLLGFALAAWQANFSLGVLLAGTGAWFLLFAQIAGLFWLATSPYDYGRTSTTAQVRSVFRRRQWWLLLTVIWLATGALLDARNIAVPESEAFLPILIAALLPPWLAAGLGVFRYLRAYPAEAVLFLAGVVAATGAEIMLHASEEPRLALLPASVATVFVLVHVLIYYKRFVGLEAELRTGLYDENLSLRKLNQRQESVLALTREAVLRLDRDERIVYANTAFSSVSGYPVAGIVGKKFREVVSKSFYGAAARALKGARSGREDVFEIMLHRKNRDDVALNVQSIPLLDGRGKFNGIHLGFFDLTEAIKARENLLARLDQVERELGLYRLVIDKADRALLITDLQCRILFASAAFTRATGFGTGDLVGRATSLYRLDKKSEEAALQSLRKGKSWQGSLMNRRKDGSRYLADVHAVPLLRESDEPHDVLWIETDAHARLAAEAELKRAADALVRQRQTHDALAEEHASIFAALETALMLVRPDGVCRFLNTKVSDILGFSEGRLGLQNLPSFVRDLLKMEKSYGQKIRSDAIDFVDEFITPAGTRKTLRWRATPILASAGEPLGVVLQVFDLTEASEQERRISQLQEELSTARKLVNERDGSRTSRLQHLLEVAEAVHARLSLKEAMQLLTEAAGALGWRSVLVYRRRAGAESFEQVASRGVSGATAKSLKVLRSADVEQYFQARFAAGGGYLLRQEALEDGRRWAFLPSKLSLPRAGGWNALDMLLLPLQSQGTPVGLIIALGHETGNLPGEGELEELERLGVQAAFAIAEEENRQRSEREKKQNKLLMDLSKIEHLDVTPEQELEEIASRSSRLLRVPVCIVTFGPPPLGAAARPGSGAARQVLHLEQPLIDTLVAQAKPLLQNSAATGVQLGKAQSALLSVLGLDLPRNGSRPALIAPLHVRRKSRGFLCCGATPQLLEPPQLAFIGELAQRAALIIENAQLFAQTVSKAQELERANTLISEFLANVSHELRTPLHTILSYVELLRKKEQLPTADRLRHLQTISNSGDRLLHLINDLLDLSKIEAGKLETHLHTFDPRELVREVAEEIATLCQQSGLTLNVQIEKNLPPLICTDRNLLARVLLNLARNAQKFTPKGMVEIGASLRKDKWLRLVVRDTGIGIESAHIQEIFEPFHQIDRKASRRYEGTGLGLPISKRLVELLGGSLTVKSKLALGTTFMVEVPVQAIWRKPRRKNTARPPAGRKNARKKSARRRQILLVDDDQSTKEAMQFLLENEGYDVEFASDGPSAISIAQHLKPDLILLDIMMPGMDGYQVARTLKAQKHLRNIPVIALTARAMTEDKERARDSGCDNFLTKPFAMDDFWKMVRQYTSE